MSFLIWLGFENDGQSTYFGISNMRDRRDVAQAVKYFVPRELEDMQVSAPFVDVCLCI